MKLYEIISVWGFCCSILPVMFHKIVKSISQSATVMIPKDTHMAFLLRLPF